MTRKRLSINQLKELYSRTTHGASVTDAARVAGCEYAAAMSGLRALKRYIALVASGDDKPGKAGKKLFRNYLVVARWAVEQDHIAVRKLSDNEASKLSAIPVPQPKEDVTVGSFTHFDKLDLSYAVFKDSIDSFIQAQVSKLVGDVMEDNRRMKELIDEARVGNFTDALRKHFEGKA